MVIKHPVKDKVEKDGWRETGAEHGRKCNYCDLMILKITYEGINTGAKGCLMLIQALHEHITAESGR